MNDEENLASPKWLAGKAPVAVVMISLNEAHNLKAALENLSGWASEVFLVDSFSADETIDIALSYGVHVVQHKFMGFGNQWNFALEHLPIKSQWTLKMDPDERLSDNLKAEIENSVGDKAISSYVLPIRLYFMGARLSSVLRLTRLWRTGIARFSDVQANEHAICSGVQGNLRAEIMHMDSPDLDHWLTKQNRYTTAEATSQFKRRALSLEPKFFGSSLQRRMWIKKNFWKLPGRYLILFFYHLVFLGAWKAGRVGWIWARLRTEVYRLWEFKYFEMNILGHIPIKIPSHIGVPDSRVRQYTSD